MTRKSEAAGRSTIRDVAARAGVSAVLFLGGKPDHTTAEGRERGYLGAHRARGLEPDPDPLLHGDFTRDSGYRLMRRVLERGPDFTAVVAATGMVAAGGLTALHEAGLDVPGDVSLAGYDDIPFARDLRPALTTVRVPYEELGRLAVRTALGHSADSPGEHLLLGTHVVVRDSVGRPGRRGR
ncbi:LacI family DNA-binding transcriptional regulator [Streptomyces puniciscabiei]|uniref:LacI family DNA-binding transcriptional regulator n=1 Tax=Streptomyces puniciscabiei TaxID=164348 RepID=UPI00332285B7